MAKKKNTGRKRSKGNKSKMIRDYMKANPKAGPKAVSQALSKPGFKVTAAFVSTVKSTDKRKNGSSRYTGGDSISMRSLLQVKEIIQLMGGVDKAKQALDAYARLVG